MPRESAEDKIARLLDEKIKAAFEDRDRAAREEKDPWARLEGMIDRAIGKRFDALLNDEGDATRRHGRDDDEEDGGGGGNVLKALGLG